MLLALKPNPMQTDIKPPLDYQPFKAPPSRYSPPESPRNIPSLFEERMNNLHRGLPPPAGLNLPPPDRGTSTAPSNLGHLPAPPSQWAGQDDSMRSWLHAKAEEDRRKQEEERTRQEGLRLDQRRIEERMLRDSLSGGIPPPMVPLIFAGIGGGNLPSHTLEWAQQYLASLSIQNHQQQQQIQVQQQQLSQQQQAPPPPPQPLPQPQMSPDMRRDNRMIPPNPYGGPPPTQSNPPPPPAQSSRPLGSTSAPQSSTSLSRLNTTEFVPSNNAQRAPLHPLSQQQTASSEQGSGNALFFHHWTPPNPNSVGNQPPTPSGKSQQGSPFGQSGPPSHLRADYQNSPKKRKAVGGHPAQPPPTSAPEGTSPSYSGPPSREGEEGTERRHSRQHSDASSRDEHRVARPSSRQQRHDELSAGANGPRKYFTHSSSGSSEERYEGSRGEPR